MKAKMMQLLAVVLMLGAASLAQAATVFNSDSGGYSAYGAQAGLLGIEDYTADLTLVPGGSNAQTQFLLTSMTFVGGVTSAGGALNFDFLDSTQTLVAEFLIPLPYAGTFQWTISNLSLMIPRVGFLRVSTRDGAIGQWFLSGNGMVAGSSPLNVAGTPTGLNFAFGLNTPDPRPVPEPGTLVLLGLGLAGLGVSRRRKAR